ncbi:MAG TPA: 3'(2'),5'-bisphosphate nucleotidase CysQ [Vicinamibacteria bacterium]|nr:3'(2'),5'-bisphosphate nucleotidase CysQ [Vicinamibacteria bacterium]
MFDAEQDTAIRLAYEAGGRALSLAGQPLKVEGKGEGFGPVTEVDRELDRFFREGLRRQFPEDLVVSEESPVPATDPSARIWYIDPIDGTMELISGNDEWSILIGLAQFQRPVLGVVHRPVTGELYHATTRGGAFRRSEPGSVDVALQVNEIHDPETAVLIQSRSHPSPKVARVAEKLGIQKTYRLGSLGLKLAKIAEGQADLYLNFSGKCHFWDLCAPEVILREAGGDVRSLRSEPIPYGVEVTAIRMPFGGAANGLLEIVARASAGIEVDP